MLGECDYFTIEILRCEAVRKNTTSDIQNNENCNFYLNIPMACLPWLLHNKVVMVKIVSAHSVVWNDTNHVNILLTKKVTHSGLHWRNAVTIHFSPYPFNR
jgi:hypothetical protein